MIDTLDKILRRKEKTPNLSYTFYLDRLLGDCHKISSCGSCLWNLSERYDTQFLIIRFLFQSYEEEM